MHYRLRGPVGAEVLLLHLRVYGLHHHDGVIHHDADGQDQREEGNEVDVHPKQLHEEEGAHEGDGHGKGGNQG